MSKLTEDEAKKILEPHLDKFRESFTASWKNYWGKGYKKVRHVHSARTRANIVYDHIVENVHTRFDGVKGMRFLQRRGLLLLAVGDRILMKFKKLNKKKLSRTYPTPQAVAVEKQIPFPGFPPNATYLVAGYQLNKLQTDMEGVFITCAQNNQLEWAFPLSAPAANVSDIPMSEPEEKQSPIRVKEENKRKKNQNDDKDDK